MTDKKHIHSFPAQQTQWNCSSQIPQRGNNFLHPFSFCSALVTQPMNTHSKAAALDCSDSSQSRSSHLGFSHLFSGMFVCFETIYHLVHSSSAPALLMPWRKGLILVALVLQVVAVELGAQIPACSSVATACSAAFFRGTSMRNESAAGMT